MPILSNLWGLKLMLKVIIPFCPAGGAGWGLFSGDGWPWPGAGWGDLCGCGDLRPGWGEGPLPPAAAGCRLELLVLGLGTGAGLVWAAGPVGIGANPVQEIVYAYSDVTWFSVICMA